MTFKIGDKVSWYSQANGSWKTKVGTVVKVANHKGELRHGVSVPPPEGSKAKPKFYCPRTSALKLLD